MITYTTAHSTEDLVQIKALQMQNLADAITEEERRSQGFVTVEHDLHLLERMNAVCPHIIAKAGSKLVGYALCMDAKFGQDIPVLRPMFNRLTQLIKSSDCPSGLSYTNYMVMGQICIAPSFRGKGIFRGLYNHMQIHIPQKFEYIITEVDSENTRSCSAHYAIGFQKILMYNAAGQQWELMLMPRKF